MRLVLQEETMVITVWHVVVRAYARLLIWMDIIASVFVFLLMLLISVDVIGRYAFDHPLYGTLEISEALLVFIVFLGFAYTQYLKGHIRIQMVVGRLPIGARPMADFMAHVVGLVMFILIGYEGARFAIVSWQIGEQTAGMVNVPLWPARFAIPVGSFVLAIQFAADAWTNLQQFLKSRRPNK